MLRPLIETGDQYFVRQQKEWTEILVDFETKNRYQVLDPQNEAAGQVFEVSSGIGGFLRRNFFGSHRALDVRVHDGDGTPFLRLSRPFFFLFSSLEVRTEEGALLGRVERRFGIVYKKFDLQDEHGRVFARVSSPFWKLWTFPVARADGMGSATISKKWGGALRELFADADTFRVAIETGPWSEIERWVLFAAALSIDFDFFENNQGSGGLFGFLDVFD